MKFNAPSLNRFILAGLLATVGASAAMAQAPAPTTPMSGHGSEHRMGRHDPAKMQARLDKHHADLKARLKITAAQEATWSRYTAAMQPVDHHQGWDNKHADLDKLTTPERIDKMRALRSQRMSEMNAAMDKRDDATKALYAALNPEQQKIFDAERRKGGPREDGAARKG